MAKVNVIIPTYKRSAMLKRAIESVLLQSYTDCQVIVVDDNNEGDEYRLETELFMKQYSVNPKVTYLKHSKNKGGSAARNTGIKHAECEYIALLDDDDEFHVDKIKLQVEMLEGKGDTWGAVYCLFSRYQSGVKEYSSSNTIDGSLQKELFLRQVDFAAGSTLLIRKSIVDELNGFDESFIRHQDWELLVRFFRAYKIACVPRVLVNLHMDCSINRPNPVLLEKVKDKFFTTFEDDINSHDPEVSTIWNKHYLDVAEGFLLSRKYSDFSRVNQKCRSLTFRNKVRLGLAFIKGLLGKS